MAECDGSGNNACVVNCIKEGDLHILHTLIEELTGQKISADEGKGSPVRWSVENKYYTANIELFVCTSSEPCDKSREYEAIIFLCNLDQPESLDSLKSSWTQLKQNWNSPDVAVVVGVASSGTSYPDMLKWCVEEGMELIEWDREGDQQPQDTDSDDGLPPEAVGVARLSETLQAHMWPNIKMKGRDPTVLDEQEKRQTEMTAAGEHRENLELDSDGLNKLESKAAATGNTEEETKKRVDNLLTEEQMSAALKDEDSGGENFEDLFSQFSQMKSHAESLPHEERKAYAERVVMAFWNAIGGDEAEVDSD